MLCHFNSIYPFKEQPIFIYSMLRLFFYYLLIYSLGYSIAMSSTIYCLFFYYILDIFVHLKLIVNKVL